MPSDGQRPISPLFEAQNAQRYERQELIRAYETQFNCRLVVLIDAIFSTSVPFFEELIFDADPAQDLHLLLVSPGGDGETAVRLARAAQDRCRDFVVLLPDQAKSAATLLTLGAHKILMGPTSDLGPVDAQFQIGQTLVAAKDIIAAVDDAAVKVQAAPETYPIYASLLSDVTALMVQEARAALARSADLLREALASRPDRSTDEVTNILAKLRVPLIDSPQSHAAIFGAKEAEEAGLPVERLDPSDDQWRLIWKLWMRYFTLNLSAYEGGRASQVFQNRYSQTI